MDKKKNEFILVSIIIPVYNVAPYLRASINSVLYQSYQNLEILLIDDGSTDGSREICDEYAMKDSRIKALHQKNRGLSPARNAGLDVASGDSIAFLDSDDMYHPNYIKLMLQWMASSDANLVVCKFMTSYPRGGGSKSRKSSLPTIKAGTYDRESSLRALVDGNLNTSVWNKLYKRELWENVRFPEGHVYEDAVTLFRILERCHKVCVIDKSLYLYRIRAGSITETSTKKNTIDRILTGHHFESCIRRNMPDVFSLEQLKNYRTQRLKVMIAAFCRYRGEDSSFEKALRRKIIRTGSGMEILDRKTRIAYQMVCFCPQLLKMVFMLYDPLRKAYERI